MDMKYLTFQPDVTGPKKLNLQHLSGTMQILLAGLALALFDFTFEIFWFKFKCSRKKKLERIQKIILKVEKCKVVKQKK